MDPEEEPDRITTACLSVGEGGAASSAESSDARRLSLAAGDASALRRQVTEAVEAWLKRSTSPETRKGYATDLAQFLDYLSVPPDALEQLMLVRPAAVSGWRDQLAAGGLTASSVRRKLTCLRSLF
jgi:hypothetical protein